MKIVRLMPDGKTEVTLEASGIKEAFDQISSFEEVFSCAVCGCCQSSMTRLVSRESKGFRYYEIQCIDCDAKMEFGQHREGGGLFPKRDKGRGGWYHYSKDGKEVEPEPVSDTQEKQRKQPTEFYDQLRGFFRQCGAKSEEDANNLTFWLSDKKFFLADIQADEGRAAEVLNMLNHKRQDPKTLNLVSPANALIEARKFCVPVSDEGY